MNNKIRLCRDCSRLFYFTEGEQKFYARKGFQPPVRCPICRKARIRNRDPYEGWEATMSPDFQKKKRHSRVPYAPYVVGGMRG